MYAYTTFAYAILAIGSFPTTLSIPIGSDSLQPLDKRVSTNVTCNPRLGGLKLSDRRSAWSQIPQTDTLIQYQTGIWSVGECTITADLIDIHQPEVLARADISAAANQVILDCVSPLRHSGTFMTGNYDNFNITLYQYDYADEEPFEEGPDPLGLCSKKESS